MDHSLPFVLLLIDFLFNRITYELNGLWINLIILFIYGMYNLAYTKIEGHSVYPVVTWDSIVADCIAFAVLPLFMLFWLGLYYMSRYKFKKLDMDAPDVELLLTLANTTENGGV